VFGRQLGVSPAVMGLLLAILPILYFFAKPLFGMMADYFLVSSWNRCCYEIKQLSFSLSDISQIHLYVDHHCNDDFIRLLLVFAATKQQFSDKRNEKHSEL